MIRVDIDFLEEALQERLIDSTENIGGVMVWFCWCMRINSHSANKLSIESLIQKNTDHKVELTIRVVAWLTINS